MPTEGFVFRYCFSSQNVTPWWTTRQKSYYNNYHRVCLLRCGKVKALVWEQWTCVMSTKEKLTKHDRLWVLSAPHNQLEAGARSAGLMNGSYSAVKRPRNWMAHINALWGDHRLSLVEELRGRRLKGTSNFDMSKMWTKSQKNWAKKFPYFFKILMKFNFFANEWK